MGRIRRGGYTFIWWIGDHPPQHIHVFDKHGELIARVDLATMRAMDTPRLSQKVVALIRQLQKEGRF